MRPLCLKRKFVILLSISRRCHFMTASRVIREMFLIKYLNRDNSKLKDKKGLEAGIKGGYTYLYNDPLS